MCNEHTVNFNPSRIISQVLGYTYGRSMKTALLLIVIVAIYLQFAYSHIYSYLTKYVAPSPSVTTFIFESNNNKYVALGDSLTYGVGTTNDSKTYPALFATRANLDLVNLGIPGATTDTILNLVPKTISLQPQIITLEIGVNDIHNHVQAKDFESKLDQIVKNLKQSNAEIYLLTVPNLGSPKILWFPYNVIFDLRTQEYNSVIKKIAKQYNIQVVDIYTPTKMNFNTQQLYAVDEFHPSEKGYILWADILYASYSNQHPTTKPTF
jgi:lysophospholipase L1-like esterase